jgi:predicted  nucleic acid-binding Zn-ribbon protein
MGILLESLRKLQKIEQDIAHVRSRIRVRNNAVNVQKRKIEQIEQDRDSLSAQSIERRKLADSLEIDLKQSDQQVVSFRAGLNAARSNKEYAAILTQINTLKVDSAKIEDRTLNVIQEIESLKTQADALSSQIDDENKRLDDINAQSEKELTKLNGMLEGLSKNRIEATEGIPAGTLSTFERISANYEGEAMAQVEIHGRKEPFSYICGGCFMTLNPEHANILSLRDEIRTCDNCGRILYIDPHAQ